MKTYSPEDVSVIVDGNILTRWVSVSVERDEDAYAFEPSTSGGGTRTKNSNKAGKFTIVLQQTSESNGPLSDLAESGDIFPVVIKDNSGTSKHSTAAGYMVKHAVAAYGKEIGEREYIIQCEVLLADSRGN
jgi:hypothetical protein